MVDFSMQEVMSSIIEEFSVLYNTGNEVLLRAKRAHFSEGELYAGTDWAAGTVGDILGDQVPGIKTSIEMLKVNS
jgi:lipoate-protein ligase A